ncbi:elongation factor G [Anaerolineales bacterium HSG24]|nr:elongation factor G [Anaerolineales bacterium HSG24]
MSKQYTTDTIRNIVLLGHSGCGKTSLAEAMVYNTGISSRLGRVEDVNTISDFDEEEINRTMSLNLSIIHSELKDHKINILDAPGYADYQGEMLSGLHVADTAVIVMDASSGIEVGTQLAWQMAKEVDKPIAIFLNKMDRPNVNYQAIITELRDTFDATFVPMGLPIRDDETFVGLVDLITQKAHTGTGKGGDYPVDMAEEVESLRFELVEFAAEGDDDLMNKYFDEETLTEEEIAYGLRMGLRNRRVIPVFCGSATENIAVRSFMNEVIKMFPHPESSEVTATNTKSGEEEVLSNADDGPFAAQVFKTVNDQYGRLSYMRIWSGTFSGDSRLTNTRIDREERIAGMFISRGKEQVNIKTAFAGDIVGAVKLNETKTGDVLSEKSHLLTIPIFDLPDPVYGVAVTPVTQADSAKLGPSLTRITEEDLTLKYRYERATRQTIFEGMGETHVMIGVKRMQNRFGLNVETAVPKVPYMETISKIGKASYRHKKQSGGAGQFGEVHMRVEPLERGEGFEYKSEIFGGSISQPFLPSIEKGIRQILEQGVIASYPVVDVKAIVFDGKEHPVDSKDIAFQIAGREAFKKAFKIAGPTILEPIMEIAVTIPEEYTGDVTSDMSTKRGRMSGMDQVRGHTIITGQIPLAEVQRYSTDLRSITQGRGVYTLKLSHYEPVPSHVVSEIIAQAQKEKENQ